MMLRGLSLLLLLLWPGVVVAETACRLPERVTAASCPAKPAAPQGEKGRFDYYVLSLSWSPHFCATRRQPPGFQCRDNVFGFVVHGLWPQYETREAGGVPGPQHCSPAAALPADLVRRHLCRVPEGRLMACEWAKHGTCGDFAGPAAYLDAIAALHGRLKLPDLPRGGAMTPAEIAAAFAAANPGLAPEHLAVTAADGALAEVRLCVARDLRAFRRCGDLERARPGRRLAIR